MAANLPSPVLRLIFELVVDLNGQDDSLSFFYPEEMRMRRNAEAAAEICRIVHSLAVPGDRPLKESFTPG